MRLGRLVAGGIVAGALAGFAAGLLRPRPRGVLPGLVVEADPPADASRSADQSSAGDHFAERPDHEEGLARGELAVAARSPRGSRGGPDLGGVAG